MTAVIITLAVVDLSVRVPGAMAQTSAAVLKLQIIDVYGEPPSYSASVYAPQGTGLAGHDVPRLPVDGSRAEAQAPRLIAGTSSTEPSEPMAHA
jgi:hypothetical protein